jgi:hypothetical protein
MVLVQFVGVRGSFLLDREWSADILSASGRSPLNLI